MRNIKELYTLLYEEIKDKKAIGSLCEEMFDSNTTLEEYKNLKIHFKSNKPTFYRHSQFFWRREFKYGRAFWWGSGTPKSTEQRKLFIKYLRDRA